MKQLFIADTLSRHPQPEMTQDILELTSELKQHTLQDEELQLVQRYVLGGWPQYSACH